MTDPLEGAQTVRVCVRATDHPAPSRADESGTCALCAAPVLYATDPDIPDDAAILCVHCAVKRYTSDEDAEFHVTPKALRDYVNWQQRN